jgi:hypothetical protein
MSSADVGRWRRWYAAHRAKMTDAAAENADRLPELVDIGSHLLQMLRHPRAFVRKILLNSV